MHKHQDQDQIINAGQPDQHTNHILARAHVVPIPGTNGTM